MSKNILILSGSPRKGGNSDLLCDQFLAGAIEAGHNGEKIFLQDKELHYCIACEGCRSQGLCWQKDDMAEILEKMIAADVLVLASPVYFYTIDAQMKTLIDRCVARYTEIVNKELYYIITAADTSQARMERTVECFRGFADCLDGAVEKGVVYGVGAWKKGDVRQTTAFRAAWDMGKNI